MDGQVFTRQAFPLHRAGEGMFRVMPAPPESGAYLHSLPKRGLVCYHVFLTGTSLGYEWGGGSRGDRARECRKANRAPGG